MTLDGFCDHTAITPDEEIHRHYMELLNDSDAILYGRITYQLMEYWKPLAENPSGEQSADDFAVAMNKIPKIVFSQKLKNVDWDSAELATKTVDEVVAELKQQPGKPIFIGSRSLIIHLLSRNLIDEFQLCVHPVIVGKGLPLFEKISDRTSLKLLKTKTFNGGAVILYYEPTSEESTNR